MTKPGFTRVFIPSRNKTTRIRTGLANNPNYLERNGMVLMPDPVAPPVAPPVAVNPHIEGTAPKQGISFDDIAYVENSESIKAMIERGEAVILEGVGGVNTTIVPNPTKPTPPQPKTTNTKTK